MGDVQKPYPQPYYITPTQTELRSRIDKAKEWVDRIYREGSTYAMVGEYPSIPLNIVVNRPSGQGSDEYSPRFLGHYKNASPLLGQVGVSSRSCFAALSDPSERYTGWVHDGQGWIIGEMEEFWVSFNARQSSQESGWFDALKEHKMDFSAFKQPTLKVQRQFLFDREEFISGSPSDQYRSRLNVPSDCKVALSIIFREFVASDNVESVDLYIGDHLIASGIDENTQVDTEWIIAFGDTNLGFGDDAGVGAGRYTIRHGCQMAKSIYEAWGETSKANKLAAFISSEGYTNDIYDPLFNQSTSEDNQFFQDKSSWHDSDKGQGYMSGHHRIGHDPYGYAYESKIHFFDVMDIDTELIDTDLFDSETWWIAYCPFMPYIMALQALHVLNRGQGADHTYNRTKLPSQLAWFANLFLNSDVKTTPRKIAEFMCNKMTSDMDIGLFGGMVTLDIPLFDRFYDPDSPIPMLGKKQWAGSGYHTACFAALCAALGYGPTDDDRFKPWADYMIRNLCYAQWGIYANHATDEHIGVDHRGLNEGATFGGNQLGQDEKYRPDHTGGLMTCWTQSLNTKDRYQSAPIEMYDWKWNMHAVECVDGHVGAYNSYRSGDAGTEHNSGHSSLRYKIHVESNGSGQGEVADSQGIHNLEGGAAYEIGAWVRGTYAAGLRLKLRVKDSSNNTLGYHYLNVTQSYNDWTKVSATFTMEQNADWATIFIEQSQSGAPDMYFDGVYLKKTATGEFFFGGDADQRTRYNFANSKGGGGIPYVEEHYQPDPFNQPIECPALLPTNMEGTGALLQVLRIYNYYKYGDAYPSATNLPTN